MEKLNVLLLAGKHPIYENIIKFPPSGVNYKTNVSLSNFDNLDIYKKSAWQKKKLIAMISNRLAIPRLFYSTQKSDLIHSGRGLMILNKKPWVVDVEHAHSFIGMYHVMRPTMKRRIEYLLSRDSCKRIMPHCLASEKSMYNTFSEKILEGKVETVYPATPKIEREEKTDDVTRILFVGKNFESKGGVELVRAFKEISADHNVELILKTVIPGKFSNEVKAENIKIITENMTREQIFNLYKKSDIFSMPTYMDTFGYVILEAISAGMPIISTDTFAVPEMVKNEINGFTIETSRKWNNEKFLQRNITLPQNEIDADSARVIKELKEKLLILIEDGKLRNKMSRASHKLVEKGGKFSIEERNKKLLRIYRKAVE